MGEEFLRERGKRFKHLSDADYEQQLATRHLFSDQPEVFTESYPCVPLNGHNFAPGDEIVIRDVGQDALSVECGTQAVAAIDGVDGRSLREAMRHEKRCYGIIAGEVERQSAISGRVYLRIAHPGGRFDGDAHKI